MRGAVPSVPEANCIQNHKQKAFEAFSPNARIRYTQIKQSAHAGSRTRVTSMGGLYDAATLHALLLPYGLRNLFWLVSEISEWSRRQDMFTGGQ